MSFLWEEWKQGWKHGEEYCTESEQKWKFELELFSGFEQCQKSKTVRLEE